MYNWNTDTSKWDKRSRSYKVWSLNQLINFGLNGQKLDLKLVKKFWRQISTDPSTKKFLKLITWQK